MREPSKCPHCGGKAIPIVYGMPGLELFERAQRDEVRLGGCVITGDGRDPTRYCLACETEIMTEKTQARDKGRVEEQPEDIENLYPTRHEVGAEVLTTEEREKLDRDRARRFMLEEGDIVWELDTELDHEKRG